MHRVLASIFALVVSLSGFATEANKAEPLLLAERFTIQSGVLGDERTISVSLPDGYAESDHRYPVIYLLDGTQNLHHAAGSRDVLARSGDMPPVILVGLTSVNRHFDMTPSDPDGRGTSGGGDKLLAHFETEVIPFVESRFRGNGFRVLVGHSLGGLFSTYALFEEPDLFSAHIVIAPALWWNQEEAINRAGEFFSKAEPLNNTLFFGIGDGDGWGMRQELMRFVAELEESERQGLRWQHQEFDGEGHMSATLRGFYHGVKFIFSDMQMPASLYEEFDVDAFVAHEMMMQEKYGSAARQSQEVYVTAGFALMQAENYRGAAAVFKRNAEAYAANRYAMNHEWLADALDKSGAKADALDEYRKAYELAAENGTGDIDKYKAKIVELGGTID